MNRRTTRRLLAGILIGAIGGLTVALGGDVTVQQGNITATGLTLTGSATVTGDLDVEGDLTAGDIDSDNIGYNSYPQGYFDNVTVNWDVDAYWVWGDAVGCRQFLAQEISYFLDDVNIYGALAVYGKFSPEGGIDPLSGDPFHYEIKRLFPMVRAIDYHIGNDCEVFFIV